MVKVKDIMRKHVRTVTPNTTLDRAAKIMTNNRIGSVVVLENKKPVGIVTAEDVVYVVARGKNPKRVWVKEVEKRGFFTASPEDTLLDVSRKMVKNRVKRLPVVDEKGQLAGIVTDKEILVSTPEMIEVLSEKLKARVERVASPDTAISGICEECEGYDDSLHSVAGQWLCEDCREK